MMRALVLAGLLVAAPVAAHTVYLAADNHTDYGWNASTDAYDASMADELDYYLAQIDLTADRPVAEQARFNADCWWYLARYQASRSPADFQRLLDAIRSRHVTVPLNPFVLLYGALPTEAAIRAGYYPGRMARLYGLPFVTAQEMENATIPWGMASIWAGSGVRYSWKGICACLTQAPFADRKEEVFRWQGPDGHDVIMKWYQIDTPRNQSWGGYAEARANLSASGIGAAIARFANRAPFLPVSGLFGAGWDDVTYKSDAVWQTVHAWNAAHAGGDQAAVSNEIDYFQAVEASGVQLPVLRGGWGNDWDLFPAALSARTAQIRRAFERLRGAEALSALVHVQDGSFWPAHQPALERALFDAFKYFEHTWSDGGAGLASVVDHKKAWAQGVDDAVTSLQQDASAALASQFATPDEDRLVVVNPLGFTRTDVADLPRADAAGVVVVDVATGAEVPSQAFTLDGQTTLRFLASDVPSLGWRVYRVQPGTRTITDPAATVAGSTIANPRWRVTLGGRGDVTSAFDVGAGRELASALNDFGSGTAAAPVAENVGPVSVTLRAEVAGSPARTVRVTLLRDVGRVELDDRLNGAVAGDAFYRFASALPSPAIHFEEVGAIARPGLVSAGGDFLPGTRADFMTLNHFVAFSTADYTLTLSNADAFAMRVGQSTPTAFDAAPADVSVLAVGNPSTSQIGDQGGETALRHRFALIGAGGGFSAAAAMTASLAHQNPLLAIALPRAHAGARTDAIGQGPKLDAPDVVVTAFKPAEEGERGLVARLWELDGHASTVALDATAVAPCGAAETSLVETDLGAAPLAGGVVQASLGANEMKTYRIGTGTCTAPAPCDACSADPVTPITDCCADPQPLRVRRVQMRSLPGGGKRIRLTASYPLPAAAAKAALGADLSLRFGDDGGRLFCALVPGTSLVRHGSRRAVYRNRRASGDGVTSATLVLRRGGVAVDVRARATSVRAPDGSALRVAVRTGNTCASTATALRRRGTAR